MYRLTICQTDMNYPYIVYDNETLDGIQKALESYRKDYDTSKFISYDLIKFDENNLISVTKCNHGFHYDCIKKYLFENEKKTAKLIRNKFGGVV